MGDRMGRIGTGWEGWEGWEQDGEEFLTEGMEITEDWNNSVYSESSVRDIPNGGILHILSILFLHQ